MIGETAQRLAVCHNSRCLAVDSTCIVCNREALLLELTRSIAVRTGNTTDHNSFSEANISSSSNFPHFMESECSLPCPQNTVTCPYPSILRQTSSVYELPSCFLTIHFNIDSPSNPRSSEWYLSFPTKTPYALSCSAICDTSNELSTTLYGSYVYWTVHHLDS